jgi:hypothetical protein
MWPRKVSQEGPPRALFRPVVMGENPSNHVFVDCKVEGQGDLFRDSRTTPAGIALLHFDDRMDEFCTRSLRACGTSTNSGAVGFQGQHFSHNAFWISLTALRDRPLPPPTGCIARHAGQ